MFIKPKHIIVTGAAGFIGSHLSIRLIRAGYEVTGIDEIWHQEAFVEWSDEAQGESMHTVVILAVER